METDRSVFQIGASHIRRVGQLCVKRSIDIVESFLLIILTSPIMLFAAIGTRLSSPDPILSRQKRVGKDKKTFKMLNLRRMKTIDNSHRECAGN